jgi:hypothetical protein
MRSLTAQGAAAVVTAVACLLLSATPASATLTRYAIVDGVWSIPDLFILDIGSGPDDDPCEVWSFPPVLETDEIGSTVEVTGPAYDIDQPLMKWTFLVTNNNVWYQADVWVFVDPGVDNSGARTGGGSVQTWNQDMYVVFLIYQLDPDPLTLPGDCEKDELVCIFGSQLALSGTYIPSTGVGVLSGGGPLDVFYCDDATIAGIVTGRSLSISGMVLDRI